MNNQQDLPPLPKLGRPTVRTVARLVATLKDGLAISRSGSATALAMFAGGQLVHCRALHGGAWVIGPEALDSLAEQPIEAIEVADLPGDVVRTLVSWWDLPEELAEIPGRWVDLRRVIQDIVARAERGVLTVSAGGPTGAVVVAGEMIIAAYVEGGAIGADLGDLGELLDDPEAVVVGRLAPRRTAPTARPAMPLHVEPVAPATSPSSLEVSASAPVVPDLIGIVRTQLGSHGEVIEEMLLEACTTPEALRAACAEVAATPVRLVTPAGMANLSRRLQEALAGRS